jgi:hypothetical protein
MKIKSMTTPTGTRVPMTLKMRGGKTIMVLPDGSRVVAQREARMDNAMVKVIARAFRWQRLLDEGVFCSIADLFRRPRRSTAPISAGFCDWPFCRQRSSKKSWQENSRPT